MGEADAEEYHFTDSNQDSKEELKELIKKDSISKLFKNKLIERAPNKMIDYFDGYIMLAYRNVLFYLKIDKNKIDKTEPSNQVEEINAQDRTQIEQLNLSMRYKIICI